jgi:hypothetical protein
LDSTVLALSIVETTRWSLRTVLQPLTTQAEASETVCAVVGSFRGSVTMVPPGRPSTGGGDAPFISLTSASGRRGSCGVIQPSCVGCSRLNVSSFFCPPKSSTGVPLSKKRSDLSAES